MKFKGKRIDTGEWVKGHYFTTPLTDENSGTKPDVGWFFLTGETRHCISRFGCVFVVDEETICRSLDIEDIEGKEMFTGDIIITPNKNWGVIVFNPPFFEVTISKTQSSLYTKEFLSNSKVIGDKFSNPELMLDECIEKYLI